MRCGLTSSTDCSSRSSWSVPGEASDGQSRAEQAVGAAAVWGVEPQPNSTRSEAQPRWGAAGLSPCPSEGLQLSGEHQQLQSLGWGPSGAHILGAPSVPTS